MITRDLADGKALLIRQADHADLSGQFAAHWGNGQFAALDPARSMVFAAARHDDHYRDVEAVLQIDPKFGRPYGHRGSPPTAAHSEALRQNIAWLEQRDPFAALMVSMHHSGLPQNRYGVIKAWQSGPGGAGPRREMTPELSTLIKQLESDQQAAIKRRQLADARVKFCYRQLQVFDLLSLYFCCDGFVDGALRAAELDQVPLAYGSEEDASISITPLTNGSIRFSPYPFDLNPLKVAVVGRVVRRLVGSSDEECRDEFERAPREIFAWTLMA
jgi:Protein of unknown function (DUF3891)